MERFKEIIRYYLHMLCKEIPNRRVGSPGNRLATVFFANEIAAFGFEVESQEFDCMDWERGDVFLTAGDTMFDAAASPYSLGCCITAPLQVVSNIRELETCSLSGKIVLLQDEIAREQLMPRNFPFYNPEEHQRIYALLDEKKPRAIIAATTHNPELAGGLYPFPLIEDGDFDIPSAYMTAEEGKRLAVYRDKQISLEMKTLRISAVGKNVVARKNSDADKKIVFCAHIDTKMGTPGAIDNASGLVVLLLLARFLVEYKGDVGIEILAVNGEDYYAASGEIEYLKRSKDYFKNILMAVNLDGAGYIHGRTAFSLYELPQSIAETLRQVFSKYKGLIEGEAWHQSDHMIFVMNGCPAVAITSEKLMFLSKEITHTEKDIPEIIDPSRLETIARGLTDLIFALSRN